MVGKEPNWLKCPEHTLHQAHPEYLARDAPWLLMVRNGSIRWAKTSTVDVRDWYSATRHPLKNDAGYQHIFLGADAPISVVQRTRQPPHTHYLSIKKKPITR